MSNFQRLPLNALKAFEAVARLGSIRAAAEELFVTHGAVSQQIKKLEAYLAVSLLERQGRGIALTAEGKHLFERLQPLFKQLASVTRDVDAQAQTGPLIIGCSHDTAVLWLVPAMPDFRTRYPDIQLEIREVPAGEEAPAEVDVAVLNQLPEAASAKLSLLSDQFFFPVCRPELVAGRDLSAPDSLLALPLLHADRGGLWSAWHREAGLHYPEARPQVYLPGGAAVISGAKAGLGVALAHSLEVREALASGSLVQVGRERIKAAQAYFIATHTDPISVKAELFIRWLREKCKEG